METSLATEPHSTGPPVSMASEGPASGPLVPSRVTHTLLVLWELVGESYAWNALSALDRVLLWTTFLAE